MFALDVSDPTAPALLWEFTHADLGYRAGQPSIVRLRNGTWATVFGNGVNGDAGSAAIFVVALDDGSLLQRIDTAVGNADAPNGILEVAVTDHPYADLQASRVYAGDLQGNLWRFDITDEQASEWRDSSAYWTLFAARDDEGVAQPITARPALARLPGRPGTMVVAFGTGSYFQSGDGYATDTRTQTIYAIFDSGAPVAGRSDLLEQTIENQFEETVGSGDDAVTYSLREVSDNTVDLERHQGWYLDLVFDGENAGERVVSRAVFPSGSGTGRIRFSTLIPTDSACGGGRSGYLMDLDLASGARFSLPVFDLTGDLAFDANDLIDGVAPSGIGFGVGEAPTTLRLGGDYAESLFDGSGRRLTGRGGQLWEGRQSWRQLR